jgi:propanol-preferring alcohol dehydrogenase
MKALVLHEANSPFDLTEVPDPVAGPGEAVAKVFSCGAGLTIQHFKAGRVPAVFPRIIGHEICAEIVEIGEDVTSLQVGDIVTSYFYLNCGHCRMCVRDLQPLCDNFGGYVGRETDGGYAEFIKLPERNFIVLPDGLDWQNQPAHVGVAMDALATPYKVLRRARIRADETVAVFGAGGGLGIHQLMMAKWAGARVIAVDTKASKFDACRDAGADEVVDASAVDVADALMELTGGNGIDVAVDYVSVTSTLEAGAKALAKAGRLVTLGGAGQEFRVNAKALLNKELDILGSRYVTPTDVRETYELMRRGDVWPIVTEIRPMEEAEELHELVENGAVTGRAALRIA